MAAKWNRPKFDVYAARAKRRDSWACSDDDLVHVEREPAAGDGMTKFVAQHDQWVDEQEE